LGTTELLQEKIYGNIESYTTQLNLVYTGVD